MCNTFLTFMLAGCLAASVAIRDTTAAAPTALFQVGTSNPGLIPAGTEVMLLTSEPINTDKRLDRPFNARIAHDIVSQSGRILVPMGAPAELVVAQVDQGGIRGTPSLELAIRSITVNGKRYPIDAATAPTTTEQGRAGVGRSRRTLRMVGGGAGLGTLVGGLAGGGSGAAIGAAVGAGAGATTQILTRGSRVSVPAESLLTFRLTEPMQLRGYAEGIS